MNSPVKVIDTDSEAGKNFVKNVETLKKELNIVAKGDKIKQIRNLTPEQINDNAFLRDFMEFSPVFKDFELVNVSIGNFGRKAGYVYYPTKEKFFRFVIHIGDPEIYYLDDDEKKDFMVPLRNGYGFIIPLFSSTSTHITIYSDPIRVVYDPKVSDIVPKIRPRNYSRTTLIYDLTFNIPEEYNNEENIEKEENEEDIINDENQNIKKNDTNENNE